MPSRLPGTKTLPTVYDFCSRGPVHRCIHAVVHLDRGPRGGGGLPVRFAATKLIEGDEDIVSRAWRLDQNELELIEHSVQEMEDGARHGPQRRPGGHALHLHRNASAPARW